jgi:dGTPase
MSETRSFLFERVYVGRVTDVTRSAVEQILLALLEYFEADPETGSGDGDPRTRAVDYVAGMTDRFALRAYEQLIGPPPDLGTGALG